MNTKVLLTSLLLACPAGAQPPQLRQGQPGLHYELKASCLGSQQSWLGGRLRAASENGWEDAFLTRLNRDGSLAWEKVFGAKEGGESVDQLAADSQGGVFAAGLISCDLAQAWSGVAPVDWNRNAYLAHVDAQGKLSHWLDLRVQASDPNQEPILFPGSLLFHSDQVLLGLTFRGKLGPLQSTPNQGAILVCDPNLSNPAYYSVPAQNVQALALVQGKLYAAGTAQIQETSQMGPSSSRPVLWDMTNLSQPKLLWQGEVAENTEIQQLGPDGLLFTHNANPHTLRLDLTSLQLETLPEGMLRLAGSLGLGYANGRLEGTQSLGDCDLVLWRKDPQRWSPQARLGSPERDFPGALVADGADLLVSATCAGRLPGQTNPPHGSQNWLWFRTNPQSSLASLGQRAPGELARQFSQRLQNLVFQEQPDYQHLVGFLTDQVVTTTPGPGLDGWRRQNLQGQNLQEWFPSQPKQAPLEPQIFPQLSGSTLVCLDLVHHGSAWFRQSLQGLVPGIYNLTCWENSQGQTFWLGAQSNPQGQARLLLGSLSRNQPTPITPWNRACQILALTAGPDHSLAALWSEGPRIYLGLYSEQGQLLQKKQLSGKECTAAFGRADGLWLVVDGQLLRRPWEGKVDLRRPLQQLKVRRIKPVGAELWLLGSRPDPATGVHQPAWINVEKGQVQTLPLDRDGFLQDAWLGPDGIWLGGEVVEDYITDVFWGRLAP